MLVRNLHDLTRARLVVIDHLSSVREAAHALSKPGVGLVVVCDGTGSAEGVVSKSDLVRHLAVARSWNPQVRTLMSRSITSCRPGDDLHGIWQTMAMRNLQNIPVLDDATRPLGILDIRDAMNALFEQEEQVERMLSDYVTGVGYR